MAIPEKDYQMYRLSNSKLEILNSLRQAVNNLTEDQKVDLLIHDLRGNVFTIVKTTAYAIGFEESDRSYSTVGDTVSATVHEADEVISYLSETLPLLPSSLANIREDIAANMDILPAVMASAHLVLDQTEENHHALMMQVADARSIGKVIGIDTSLLTENTIMWGSSIIEALNAAKNAVRFADQAKDKGLDGSAVMFLDDHRNLVITNISPYPLPESYFELGMTGEGGNTGMGTGLMNYYFAMRGIDIQSQVQQTKLEDNKGWLISVTIPR